MAFRVRDQLHEQHAAEEAERLRHAYTGGNELIERVYLGVLPGGFLFLAAVAGALGHGAGLTAAAHFATFLVLRACLKATRAHVLVDLGAAHFLAAADHVNGSFLAAFQLATHLVDDAVIEENLEGFGDTHEGWKTKVVGMTGFEPATPTSRT